MTAADQAALMKSLDARTAVAMDAGGSAQLAVRDDLVIPWSGARSLSDVVVMSYRGVTIEPLPFRISPNADRVDDAPTTVVRSPVAGTTAVKIIRRSGRPSKQLWRGRLGRQREGERRPAAAGLCRTASTTCGCASSPDDGGGVTEQPRRVIVDRTLGSLNATQSLIRVGNRRQPRLTVTFRLSGPARATVRIRTDGGDPIATIASGRPLRAGAGGELEPQGARQGGVGRGRGDRGGPRPPRHLRAGARGDPEGRRGRRPGRGRATPSGAARRPS